MTDIILLLLFMILLAMPKQRDIFDKSNSSLAKTIGTFAIILRHMIGLADGELNRFDKIFVGNGFLYVGCFFLISGYGTALSLDNNDTAEYWIKRISKIVIPFIMATLLMSLTNELSYGKLFVSWEGFLSADTIVPHVWYVYVLLLLYAITIVSRKLCVKCGRKVDIILIVLFCIIYIITCIWLKMNICWFMSVLAFPFGYWIFSGVY